MADKPLAPMTDWQDRLYTQRGLGLSQSWDDYLTANLIKGPTESDAKPCRPIPCPGSSLGYVEIFDQLREYVEYYRDKMLTSAQVTVYMPQWAVDKLTPTQLQLMEQSNITIETRW